MARTDRRACAPSEHCLMEPCKKAAPAQADHNWNLQAMTALQASIKLLWWQPVNNWLVRVMVGAHEVITEVLWLQNVWFSYHPCSESQLEERTVSRCWWWHLQMLLSYMDRGCATQTLWTNQGERHTPLRMVYLARWANELLLCEQFQACPAFPQLPVSFLGSPWTCPWPVPGPWQRAHSWVMPEHGHSSLGGFLAATLLGRMRQFISIDVNHPMPVGPSTWEHS